MDTSRIEKGDKIENERELFHFHICLPFRLRLQLLKKRACPHSIKLFSLKVGPILEGVTLSGEQKGNIKTGSLL